MNPRSLIKKALAHSKNPVVAFSGGKDSTVVLHLVRSVARKDIRAVFCNTGVEYPETVRFCKSISNLIELKPEKTFWQCVDEYGWPQVKAKAKTHGNLCCMWLKERPAMSYYKENNIDLVFTGLTSAESRNRMMLMMRLGPYYFAKTQNMWKCHPISEWTAEQVWEYIRAHDLKYNPIYDRGAVRCGCGPCTAYISWKKRLARENPKLLRIILQKQGQAQLDFNCRGEVTDDV